jgi:GNAT superfamily N-acetyltransferase
MGIKFRPYRKRDFSSLYSLINKLYKEDPGYARINASKIKSTINELTKYKEKGKIVIFQSGKENIGYSILLNYWSNEYGGNILIIDEIYILPDYRRKGYATVFLKHLINNNKKASKGIQLEVGKKNKGAYRLYKDFGFDEINNRIMFYNFKESEG